MESRGSEQNDAEALQRDNHAHFLHVQEKLRELRRLLQLHGLQTNEVEVRIEHELRPQFDADGTAAFSE